MSVCSYGRVIIGVKLNHEALNKAVEKKIVETSTEISGCPHGFNLPPNYKFCPICGAEKTIIVRKERDQLSFLKEIGCSNMVFTTDSEDIFVTDDIKYIASTEDINAHGGYNSINLLMDEDHADLRARLVEKLEPYGLWNEDDFRIWIVGECQ